MHFGEKLLALRRQKGMSQEALAAELGVSRQAVSKWELGDAMPDVENILKLSILFDVSTDYLLRDDIPSQSRPQAGFVPPNEKRKSRACRILAIVSIAVGALGNLILYVLSTMILVPVPGIERQPDGRTMYLWDGRRGYSYKYFIEEYRLDAIRAILILLILAGAAYLLWENRGAIQEKLRRKPRQDTAQTPEEEN